MKHRFQTYWRISWMRLRVGLGRAWRRLRRIKFRQVMGVIIILKTFNPLWFLLALTIFAFMLVKDVQSQLQPSLDMISSNYSAIIDKDLVGLQSALNNLHGAMQALGSILTFLRDVVRGIIGFVNTIINGIAWFFGMDKIKIDLKWLIPDFSIVFQPFNDLAIHVKGLFEGILSLFSAVQVVLTNLWERFKVFVFLAVAWAITSIFASAYAEVIRGLDMIRGLRGQAEEPAILPHPRRLDTPPVLILSQSKVTTPVLQGGPQSAAVSQRSFIYQERYLLSAMGVWPGRHAPLLYHQLVDQTNPGVWDIFWEGLTNLGYDLTAVAVVVSAETTDLAPGVQKYLPQAHIAESIETQVLTALPGERSA